MAYRTTDDSSTDVRERMYLPELLRGLAITTRHFLQNLFGQRDRNPEVVDRKALVTTVEYPDERIPYPPGYRGTHRLVPREDGKPRCVACYMCATVCPAQCIYIEAGEYDPADTAAESRVIEKFPTAFVIDELRCIMCGLCVEACPKDAIRMDTAEHPKPEYTRTGFVYDIPRLLRGAPAAHPSDPWYKRPSSEAPDHVHKEAHARIGDGLVQLKVPELGSTPRIEVVTDKPVPITKFHKG